MPASEAIGSTSSVPLPPNGFVLEFDTTGWTEVARWVMSFGAKARVLEPPLLVDRVCKELAAALRGYGGS
jgi:predicted DNA-binding transcriptional regulator YafY